MKKIKLNNIFYFLLLFPYIKSTYLSLTVSWIDMLYNICTLCSFTIICLLYLKKNYKSKICFWIFIYELILVISSVINQADIVTSIKDLIKIISFCMIVDYGMKRDLKSFMFSLMNLLELHIYINFLSILIYKDGLYVSNLTGYTANYFLGYDNLHILYILPALLISKVYSYLYKNNRSIRTLLLIIISLISIIVRWSATGLVGIVLFMIYIIFAKWICNRKFFKVYNYIIANICLFFAIIIFRLQNAFEYIIVDVLKKDLTFTNRTYIWDYILDFIKKKPFIGYGVEEQLVKLNKTRIYKSLHAHNQILEILYQGGFLLLISFAFIIYNISKKINECKNRYIKGLFAWVILTYFIMMLTEAYSFELIFFVFVFIFNIDIICNKKEVKPCEQKVVPKI